MQLDLSFDVQTWKTGLWTKTTKRQLRVLNTGACQSTVSFKMLCNIVFKLKIIVR
jgi:hypothetical protein